MKNKNTKKQNHIKPFLLITVIFVGLATIGMIGTGGWNPFKDREPDPVAVDRYENSMEEMKDLWISLGNEVYDPEKHRYPGAEDFGPEGTIPFGFEIWDYGTNAIDGCFIKICTASSEYNHTYTLNFDAYYMKNKDYAAKNINNLLFLIHLKL